MPVAFAMAQVPFTNVAAPTSLLAIVTATATNSTLWAYVAVTARQMPTTMASVTTWTTAWVHWTLVVCATGLVRSTNADVPTSQPVTATVTETSSTPWVCAVVTALQTPMQMAFVTTLTTV